MVEGGWVWVLRQLGPSLEGSFPWWEVSGRHGGAASTWLIPGDAAWAFGMWRFEWPLPPLCSGPIAQ